MTDFGNFVTRHYSRLQEKITSCVADWHCIPGFPKDGSIEEQRDFTVRHLMATLPEESKTDRLLERVIIWYLRSGLVAYDDTLKPEDFPKISEAIEIFEQKKKKFPKEKRNINQFATWATFIEFLEPYREKIFLTTKEKDERDARFLNGTDAVLVWQSATARIIHLKTELAAVAYGKGTAWCTAYTDKPNFFKDYTDDLLLIEEASGARILCHLASCQWKDEQNQTVLLKTIINRAPELVEALQSFFKSGMQRACEKNDAYAFSHLLLSARVVPSWRIHVPDEFLSKACDWAGRDKLSKALGYLCEDCAQVPEWNERIKADLPSLIRVARSGYSNRAFCIFLEKLSANEEWAKRIPITHFGHALETAFREEDCYSLSLLVSCGKELHKWGDYVPSEKYKQIFRLLAQSGESGDMYRFLQAVDKQHPAYKKVNYELLEGLALATAYRNRLCVEEILNTAKNNSDRTYEIVMKLIEFLDSLLLEKENRNLVQLFSENRHEHGEKLSEAFQFLTNYFCKHLEKKYKGLNDFLKLLIKIDEKGFWRDEFTYGIVSYSSKKSEQTTRAVLRSYGYDNDWFITTAGLSQHKFPKDEAIAKVLPHAVLKAGQEWHEASLAFLLRASRDKPPWRKAIIHVLDETLRQLEKPDVRGSPRHIHRDIQFLAKNLRDIEASTEEKRSQ